jgi:hypothetical protein
LRLERSIFLELLFYVDVRVCQSVCQHKATSDT